MGKWDGARCAIRARIECPAVVYARIYHFLKAIIPPFPDSPKTLMPPTAQKLVRGLGSIDATMIVVGSMIGSGIFITSAESARLSGAPGWLLLAWVIAGLLTMTGALCCSELATMMPRAGGVY